MVEALGLLVIGILVAAFVGYNIGGSSTGVAFGPAVGSRIVGKAMAGGLFTLFALIGGWTVGRNVVETMGGEIVPASQFTLVASVAVLFFTGFALLISNLYGVPASTSMTAVGAIVGLGLASDTLNETVMFAIVSAWIISPVIAFWVGAVIGRYIYPYLDARFSFNRIEGNLIRFDRSGVIPKPTTGENVTRRDLTGALLVLAIACYMGFSAGASNVANAVAPLVGSGVITVEEGVLLAIVAIALGALTIARRTLDTVGDGLTDLPILAALIVSTVSATIITVLSQLGIPASLAVSATMCIVGLGWGRASRTVSLSESLTGAASAAVHGERPAAADGSGSETTDSTPDGGHEDDPGKGRKQGGISAGALTAESEGVEPGPTLGTLAAGKPDERPTDPDERPPVPPIGEESAEQLGANDLFDPAATGRVMVLWVLTPSLSALGSFLLFEFVLLVGL